MRRIFPILAIVTFMITFNLNIAQEVTKDTLTVEMAIDKALKNYPGLKVYSKMIEAAKANVVQSGLYANPEFSIEAENILGNKEFAGFRSSEITVGFSQQFYLTSRIKRSVNVERENVNSIEWSSQIKRLEIISEVRTNYWNALVLSELIKKNRKLLLISKEFVENLELRVRAGKISPAEVSRAKLLLSSIEINISKLKSDYESALAALRMLMSDPSLKDLTLTGKIDIGERTLKEEQLFTALKSNPGLKKIESELKKQKEMIELEKSKAIPPVNVFAGIRRITELNVNTFVLGATIPLPVFDRNQGSIQREQAELERIKQEYNALMLRLENKLKYLIINLKKYEELAGKLKFESLPAAEEAYEIIKKGNELGRFTILDVLDAQRTLIEIQNQYLEVVKKMHKTIIDIETLINQKIK